MSTKLTIAWSDEIVKEKAIQLAECLQLSIDCHFSPQLCVTPQRLELRLKGFNPLFVDFDSTTLRDRRKAGKNQGLIQALKPTENKLIVDATAGWGKDAAILASFGARVKMIERNPLMAALLQDGLTRLPEQSPLYGRLSLYTGDAKQILSLLKEDEYPDEIYIDPMHPERQKSALVKKEMQVLQELIGTDIDALELLEIAISRVREKVVVKWPKRSEPLKNPSYNYIGKTVRFDVYTRDHSKCLF